MDLNPHKFQAPWTDYEFASHAIVSNAEVLILSMAWLTNLSRAAIKEGKEEPDMDTLMYWMERLKPLVMGEREVIVVCANRCGEEVGKNPAQPWGEDGVRYAGSSWVGKVGGGEVKLWGISGRGREEVLVVDTEDEPRWVLRMTPTDEDVEE
jgi:protein N-terminal amidase